MKKEIKEKIIEQRIRALESAIFPVIRKAGERQKRLTEKQREILELIGEYIKKNKKSPTIFEIKKLRGYMSLRTVEQFLEILERDGYIIRNKYEKRGIRIRQFTYYINLKKGMIIKVDGVPMVLLNDSLAGTNTKL